MGHVAFRVSEAQSGPQNGGIQPFTNDCRVGTDLTRSLTWPTTSNSAASVGTRLLTYRKTCKTNSDAASSDPRRQTAGLLLRVSLLFGWQQDIQRARKANGGILGPIEREATAWKSALENAKTDEERDSLHEGLLDKLDGLIARSAKGNHDARWNDLPGQKDAEKFHGIAAGKRVKFAEHLDEYLAAPTTKLTEKVANQIRTDVLRCQNEECPLNSDVTRRAIQQWIDKLLVTEDKSGRYDEADDG